MVWGRPVVMDLVLILLQILIIALVVDLCVAGRMGDVVIVYVFQ